METEAMAGGLQPLGAEGNGKRSPPLAPPPKELAPRCLLFSGMELPELWRGPVQFLNIVQQPQDTDGVFQRDRGAETETHVKGREILTDRRGSTGERKRLRQGEKRRH